METHKRLTHYDRERIASLLLLDYKLAQIAKKLCRHRSVITREIRNKDQLHIVGRRVRICILGHGKRPTQSLSARGAA
ncbi:helix-turn-helix domain-containing protein [Natronogracilivirga saccharolytica]|uniref:Helix-turn-helix domain-containing protein n=1 Tax=Natronogracilivirga saccharolytica TaxID=2812953 RepID=A0A8J7RLQ1_9BACT|nr:helix-turn-helix domain-containing protein [Natronogracilivirga saccharolytica]